MRGRIVGLGEWRGQHARTNDAWPAEAVAAWRARAEVEKKGYDATLVALPDDIADRISAIGFARDAEDPFLGAKHRYVADPTFKATEAAAEAARAALRDAGLAGSDVDLVLHWDAVPDRPGVPGAPKVAFLVGATRAQALDVQAGCASPITQLEVALAMIETGRARHVLCVQTHVVHRIITPFFPISANVGDSATAFVVSPSERRQVVAIRSESDGSFHDAVVFARGKDDETDTPWWTAGGPFQFGTRDRARAQQLMKETVKVGVQTIREATERARADVAQLDVVVSTHPRGWIPAAIAESLGLPRERAVQTYEQIAHVGGCGVIANLIEARRRGLVRDGARVALYSQGFGFTRSAALLEW